VKGNIFTDLFIRRPVLAIVVNLIILIAGFNAWNSLSVRQYPLSENAAVQISTVYVGASAELVRGFITTPLERAIGAAEGIDYVESKSLQGISIITARLKLNYDSTKALADISSKVDQVRNDLPIEAQVPAISVQSADSEFAAAYLSFSSDILSQEQITDYLDRVVQPRLSAVTGVQRIEIFGARTFAMRVWLKPKRMAALGISPSQVQQALAANNYLKFSRLSLLTTIWQQSAAPREHWYKPNYQRTLTFTVPMNFAAWSSIRRMTSSYACKMLQMSNWAPKTTTHWYATQGRQRYLLVYSHSPMPTSSR